MSEAEALDERLLDSHPVDEVREIYRDPAGRYVLDLPAGPHVLAEWPQSLDVVDTWTDTTQLAGDDTGGTTILLALTPQPGGKLRADPVPMDSRSRSEAFAFGYSGGTPTSTYFAIMRCALGGNVHNPSDLLTAARKHQDHQPGPASQLWHALSTKKAHSGCPGPKSSSGPTSTST